MTAGLPKRLRPGDAVGIVSPSSPVEPESLERNRRYFEGRGYRVIVAPHALAGRGFLAGPPEARADDCNRMLRDPGVRLVLTSTGGAGAAHLLPLLDYAAFAADPKFVCALSDPSIVLLALTAVTGVPTFHGPNGVDFGVPAPARFSEENFWPLVERDLPLPYAFPVGDEMAVLRGGAPVEGRLFGGNLRRVEALIGTRWMPDLAGAVLFIEEIGVSLPRLDLILTHLRLAGVFDRVAGVVVAQLVDCGDAEHPDGETLDDVLLRACAGGAYPIVTNIRCGHTDAMLTLPVGCRVRLDTARRSLELLEPATC